MTDRDANALDREYQALAEGRGFVVLNGWTSISVTGVDRQAFLNNFCTNDVKRLQPGDSCEAFVTNVKGKIVGHGLVICGKADLVFVGAPGQGTRLVEHLGRYVIREDVLLLDTTSKRVWLFVTGRDYGPAVSPMEWKLLGPVPCGLAMMNASTLTQVRSRLLDQGLVECDSAAFDSLRIEAGTPLFGVDFDEQNFPQEVGRDRQAISFTKGCYLGQETVARIDALGHVNQRIAGVRFDGDQLPSAGTELTHEGAAVGHVTSTSYSPRLKAVLALSMVRRGHDAPGTRLESGAGTCEVVALPL